MTLDSVKAILLSAGYGTRLQPLTDFLPKALVPLVGKPLIRHTISRLLQTGITSIGINTHHHAALMQKFADDQNDCDLHLSHEPDILGSAGGIKGFHEFIDNDNFFLALNADSVSDIAFEQHLPVFLKHNPLVMMLLHDCPGYNNVCVNSTGSIIDLRDTLRPADTYARLAYTGIAYIHRDFLKLIPPGASELIPLLLKTITEQPGSVRAAVSKEIVWRDIGSPKSYFDAHREIMLQHVPLIPDGNIPPKPFLIRESSVIAEDCSMEGFVAIGSNCVIEPGCTLSNCILWDHTTIAANTAMNNTICSPGFTINV